MVSVKADILSGSSRNLDQRARKSSFHANPYRVAPYPMHNARERRKLLGRVKRIGGLVAAIERALEAEATSEQLMHLVAGVRGATAGLMAEIVEDHVRHHLVDADKYPRALNAEAAEQLIEVVRTYLK